MENKEQNNKETEEVTQLFSKLQESVKENDDQTLITLINRDAWPYFIASSPTKWFEQWFRDYPHLYDFFFKPSSKTIMSRLDGYIDIELYRENYEYILSVMFRKENDGWKLRNIAIVIAGRGVPPIHPDRFMIAPNGKPYLWPPGDYYCKLQNQS